MMKAIRKGAHTVKVSKRRNVTTLNGWTKLRPAFAMDV